MIAIQAYNIATERNNHDYYRLYKRRVKHIMKCIQRGASNGKLEYIYHVKGIDYVEETVLKQIASELNEIGYECNVYEKKSRKGDFLDFEAKWERK